MDRRLFLRNVSLAVIGGIFVPKYGRWFRRYAEPEAMAPAEAMRAAALGSGWNLRGEWVMYDGVWMPLPGGV